MSTQPINTKKALDDVIKSALGEHNAEMRKESEGRFAELQKTITSLQTQLEVATKAALGSGLDLGSGVVEKGITFARICRALAFGKGDVTKARTYAEMNKMGEGVMTALSDEVQKALATQPGATGGYIVPPGYSEEIIELLYHKTAVRALGATTIPMPNGNMAIPKEGPGIEAEYIGENEGQNATQNVFGVVTLAWKKLRATTAISNDLIRFSSPKADTLVRNQMVNKFRVREDKAFLLGAGSGTSPKGLDNWIPAANARPASAGSDLTEVVADLLFLPRVLEENDIPEISRGFVFSPRTKYFLMGLRDMTGNFYFMEEMRNGTLLGVKYISTNQIVSNDGTGLDESKIIYGDFESALIGESSSLEIDVSDVASYKSSGVLVSAYDLDQTVIRGIARHDFGVKRVEAFAKLTAVKWGA